MSRWILVASLLCVCLALSLASPPVGADGEYDIRIRNSVDTPDRTATVEGTDYELTRIARTTPGDSFTVDVTAPAGEEYDVRVQNADGLVDTRERTGSGSVRFDTDGYGVGSFVVSVWHDGTLEDLHPLVVAGYDVEASVPGVVESGSDLTVRATLTGATDAPPGVELVEVVVVRDDRVVVRVDATERSGTYEATVAADFDPGEYTVFVNVRGEMAQSPAGEERRELLAFTDGQALTVTAGEGTTGGAGVAPDGAPADGNDRVGDDPSSSDVITPAPSASPTSTGTTAVEGPLIAIHALLALLIAVGAVWRIRRRRRR